MAKKVETGKLRVASKWRQSWDKYLHWDTTGPFVLEIREVWMRIANRVTMLGWPRNKYPVMKHYPWNLLVQAKVAMGKHTDAIVEIQESNFKTLGEAVKAAKNIHRLFKPVTKRRGGKG